MKNDNIIKRLCLYCHVDKPINPNTKKGRIYKCEDCVDRISNLKATNQANEAKRESKKVSEKNKAIRERKAEVLRKQEEEEINKQFTDYE